MVAVLQYLAFKERFSKVWARGSWTCWNHWIAKVVFLVPASIASFVSGCLCQLQQTTYLFLQASSPLSSAYYERHSPLHISAAWTLTIFSTNGWLGHQMLIGRDKNQDVPLWLLHGYVTWPIQSGYSCSKMYRLQMEHRVLNELIWSPCLHPQDKHQAYWNGPAQTIVG